MQQYKLVFNILNYFQKRLEKKIYVIESELHHYDTPEQKVKKLPNLLSAIATYRMLYLNAKKEILIVAKERDIAKSKQWKAENELDKLKKAALK